MREATKRRSVDEARLKSLERAREALDAEDYARETPIQALPDGTAETRCGGEE